MFVSKIILTVLFLICTQCQLTLQETVKVTLYYEALCPYCHDFVRNQLYPGFQTLGNSLNLELVPYGGAKHKKVHGKWQTSCHHGPKECYANKLQACVLNQNYTQEESMNFIGCMMMTDNPEKKSNGRKCANNIKLTWKTIKTCADGEEGNELLAHFGSLTHSLDPPVEYVPYILYNDVHNKTLEDSAKDDFLKTTCDLFTSPPSDCPRQSTENPEF